MIITAKFVPLDNGIVKTTAPLAEFKFRGSDLETITRLLAQKVQFLEAEINDDPQKSDRNRVWFVVTSAKDTNIPTRYLEKEINSLMTGYLSGGDWNFWDPR